MASTDVNFTAMYVCCEMYKVEVCSNTHFILYYVTDQNALTTTL